MQRFDSCSVQRWLDAGQVSYRATIVVGGAARHLPARATLAEAWEQLTREVERLA